jgi:prevent-host-death family protein
MITFNFEKSTISMSKFRDNISKIIENLTEPKIILNRNTSKAVVVPYNQYKEMEQLIDKIYDLELLKEAEYRLNDADAEYESHDNFFAKYGV